MRDTKGTVMKKTTTKTIQPLTQNDQWFTTEEAANHMRYQPTTLNKWACTGLKGPRPYGEGKDRRYKKSECDAWLQRSHRETADTLQSADAS